MENALTKKKFNRVDIIAIICFIAAFVFLFIRSGYGFGIDDETLYLSVPYRLIRGDSLLTDEWHISQLLGFILYIPMKLYLAITGSTEGIMLYFRHVFVVAQGIVSALIYAVLRKNGKSAIFSMLIFMLHVQLTYFVISYYTAGILFTEVVCIIMCCEFENKKFLKKFLIGFFIPLAVLGEPFLLIPIFIYAVICLVRLIISKTKFAEKYLSENVFSMKTFLTVCLGILPIFLSFVTFVLSRTTIKKLIECVPIIVSDPEHTLLGENSNLVTLLPSLFEVIKVSFIGLGIFVAVLIAIAIDKKKIEHRKIYLLLSFVGYVVYIVEIIVSRYTANMDKKYAVLLMQSKYLYWMMPLAFFSLICYLLCENKKKNLFYSFWLMGLIMVLCLDISTDIGPLCSTSGFAISDTAGIIFVFDLVKEIKEKEDKSFLLKIVSCISIATLVLQLGTQLRILTDIKAIAFEYASESEEADLNVKIDKGPAKGLITTEQRNEIYNMMISDLSVVKEKCNGRFMFTENYPWTYLYMEKELGTFSEWFLGYRWFKYEGQAFRRYLEINPENIPEYIYVTNRTFNYFYEEKFQYAMLIKDDLCKFLDCEVERLSDGYMIHVKGLK